MKAFSVLLLASLVNAIPSELERRQFGGYNDLKGGTCKDVTFVFVRGTFEGAPVGSIIGPGLISAIKSKIPNTAVQGVAYSAGVAGNLMPGGGDPAGISEAKKDYELAASKCPQTVIIGGGYSQGAAITHRAVEQLSASVKGRIAGIVLYGDTQNSQSGGKIKGFPPEKAKVYCNGYGELKGHSSDGVCGGLLNVNGGHMSYSGSFSSAATWLSQKVQEYKRTGGSRGSTESAGGLPSPKGAKSGKGGGIGAVPPKDSDSSD